MGLDAGKAPELEAFARLVLERNRVMNLTAITDEADFARLHLLDSAALLNVADFAGKRVIDVGTGAGFPGVPLKILCPAARLTLLDATAKRMEFLREACASLGVLCELCLPLVRVGGRFLAMKSVESGAELERAMGAVEALGGRLADVVDYTIPTSDVTHRVIVIEKVVPTPKGYPRPFGQIKKKPL